MKSILAILMVIYLVDSAPNPMCKKYPNGEVAHPTDVHKFYKCAHGQVIGSAFDCPLDKFNNNEQLVFDEAQQICVHSASGLCPQPNGVFEYEPDNHKFIDCFNGEGAVKSCPPDLVFMPKCHYCGYGDEICDN